MAAVALFCTRRTRHSKSLSDTTARRRHAFPSILLIMGSRFLPSSRCGNSPPARCALSRFFIARSRRAASLALVAACIAAAASATTFAADQASQPAAFRVRLRRLRAQRQRPQMLWRRSRSAPARFLERLLDRRGDGIRRALDQQQQHTGGPVGPAAALFPIPERTHAQTKTRRELRLAHAEPAAQLPDVDDRKVSAFKHRRNRSPLRADANRRRRRGRRHRGPARICCGRKDTGDQRLPRALWRRPGRDPSPSRRGHS